MVDGETMVADTVPSVAEAGDRCRWVDTDCMLADALTKQMTPQRTRSNHQHEHLELATTE